MAEYIEREAFLEHMERTSRYFDVKFDIEEFPAADVAPVRYGRWIDDKDRNGFLRTAWRKCSSCGGLNFSKKPPYCSNCGARMDGGADT